MFDYKTICLWSAVFSLLSCGSGENGGSAVNVCEATQYGLNASAPDNTAAFQGALLSCAGQTMHVPTGTYKFAPGLAYRDANGFGNGVAVPDGTSIVGDGPGKTVLQIEGPGNYAFFLRIQDAGNLSIHNLTFIGNNARPPPPPPGAPACYYDYGHAILIQSTSGSIGNISIVGTEFLSFTSTSWIRVLGGDSGNGVGVIQGPVTIEGNHFKSIPGNSVAPEQIACPASAVEIQGLGPVASVANVVVSGNVIEAEYIKTGVAVWSGARDVTIANNTVVSAGKGLPVPYKYSNGSYGILVYQHHAVPPSTMVFAKPTAISILNNEIVSPYSSGIYVAGGRNVRIVGNSISGQVDTYDVTEPRGAISLNTVDNDFDSVRTPISENYIRDSAIGISIAGGVLPIVDSNSIESVPTGGIGIKVDGIVADGVMLTLTNTTIVARWGADNVSSLIGFFPSDRLQIDGLYQTGAAYPMRWYTDVVGTPPQPQNEYCSFQSFGSISRVFIGNPECAPSHGCWTIQAGYWPNYGVGCPSGG